MHKLEKIRSKALEFTVPLDWAISRRAEHIKSFISDLKKDQSEVVKMLINPGLNKTEREFIFLLIGDLKEKQDSLAGELKELASRKQSRITDDMILMAKQHPIENILEVKNGKALCFNHNDKNPSLDCRNNFAYCYVCDKSWDTIGIVMKTQQKSFNEAVMNLCGR